MSWSQHLLRKRRTQTLIREVAEAEAEAEAVDEEKEVVVEEAVMMGKKVMTLRKKKKRFKKSRNHDQIEDLEEIGVEEAKAPEVTAVGEEAVTMTTRMISSSMSQRHTRTTKDKKQLTTKAADLRTSDMCTRPDLPSPKSFDA